MNEPFKRSHKRKCVLPDKDSVNNVILIKCFDLKLTGKYYVFMDNKLIFYNWYY